MALSLAAFVPSVDHVRRSFFSYAVFVFVLALWRYAASDVFDPYKCGSLLGTGEWLDDVPGTKGPSNWQPPGCIFHKYNAKEASLCLRNQHVLFAGDSTVRQLFWQTVKTLDPSVSETSEKHSDIRFVKDGLNVEFLWDPYLNSTVLPRLTTCGKDKEQLPNAYVVLGGGLWFARYLGDNGVNLWKENIDRVIESVRACPEYYHLPFLLPVTVPRWEKLDVSRSATILRDEIKYMNDYLKWASQQSNLIVPSALNEMMTKSVAASDDSGIHSTPSVAKAKADVLLNMRCNQQVMKATGYPMDKTCCFQYPSPNLTQWVILLVTVIVLPTLYVKSSGMLSTPRMWNERASGNALVTAGFIFATTLTYCYIADRTSLFNKASKQFVSSNFTILTLVTAVVGLLTIRRSDSEQGFMGRDQSNEWKGWMQVMILIYHITGASKVLTIYKLIRVTVAAYLFMTGYGHTTYFYKKKDFSIKRVASVLVRLNLLSCALAYIMNTDYLFYYFAPLSSFWFLVVYFTMKFQAQYNDDLKFLCSKVTISAIAMYFVVSVEGMLDIVWYILQRLFFVTWDLREWRFRVILDIWIVYIGMLGAILAIKIQEYKFLSHPSWPTVRVGALAGSVLALFLYRVLMSIWGSKQDYNAFHPYISVLPIVGFLFLRNATHTLRNVYSTAFAWVGACSLETFTLQFHIWMAADTHGILEVISSRHRILNLLITTPLFLYISSVTADATGKLTNALINGMKKPAPKPAPEPPMTVLLPVTETGVNDEKDSLPQVSSLQVEDEQKDASGDLASTGSGSPRFAADSESDGTQASLLDSTAKTQPDASEAQRDLEKGDVFGVTAPQSDENASMISFATKVAAHPVVEGVWLQMGDMNTRLLTLLLLMWAVNVGSAYERA
ncbi:10 TM acyl transferase domain found in Cas1p-domain-containing protein [Lipomyces chichibuensis]|uniref:10 TM acyl transferase domain found in Cas1p-domain-containing protein n=1 Tax=Lipomyces chichibuensis TaxID=1546026 RepID=UPI0033431475